jgi:hypothetical protein
LLPQPAEAKDSLKFLQIEDPQTAVLFREGCACLIYFAFASRVALSPVQRKHLRILSSSWSTSFVGLITVKR